ncbi:MAG: DUF4159 domain-containing protein [Planctomycetota bacterium]|jgi:hypothetical protein
MSMRVWITLLLAVGVSTASSAGQDLVTPERLTDEHVTKAIDAIVSELYERRDERTFWDPATWVYSRHGDDDQAGGYTALAVLSLLYAGQSYQDPRLRDAVAHLAGADLAGTYAIAVRAHVWGLLPPRFRPELERDAEWLMGGFSDSIGGWDYVRNPTTTRRDNSLRQYGALGLWEAAKRGVEVDRRYWHRLETAFLDNQLADGGWNYRGDDGVARGSMTAAGLTILFITEDLLHAGEAVKLGGATDERHRRAIRLGLDWMDEHFSPTANPGRDSDFYYYLYGVERVGLASGYKFFGGRDWFREGAAELIRRLCAWDPAARTMTVHRTVAGRGNAGEIRVRHLAFALMFLSRGGVPAAINKLRAPSTAWNNRPRDAANLVRWIRRSTEKAVSWQIVGLDTEPEQWLDAPLLYFASHEALPWSVADGAALPVELERLRRYLDLGGMLLAVNEGPGDAFVKSVEAAGRAMYPHLEWRRVGADHWAYTLHWPVAERRPPLRALSNGVRDLIVVSPTDLAATLQAGDEDRADHYRTAANLYFYASELNRPRRRLARAAAPSSVGPARRTVTVARGLYDGPCRPEPAALDLLAGDLRAERAVALQVTDVPLADLDGVDPPPALVIVSGTDEHAFTDAERRGIAGYVGRGGTILFETAGGRGSFCLSAERMATEVFGQPMRTLVRSPIITGDGLVGAVPLRRVEYRPYALEAFGGPERTPRLRAIRVDGRPAVLFSREDLSHALLDQPCWGVVGYGPRSARDLLGNLIEFAASGPAE